MTQLPILPVPGSHCLLLPPPLADGGQNMWTASISNIRANSMICPRSSDLHTGSPPLLFSLYPIPSFHVLSWEQISGSRLKGGVLVDEKLGMTQQHMLAAQKGQTSPGLQPKECGQQGKGGDSPPCSALVRPQLESCIQIWGSKIRRTWNCWSKARAGYKDDQRAGTPLL